MKRLFLPLMIALFFFHSAYGIKGQGRHAAAEVRDDLPTTGRLVQELKPFDDAMQKFMTERGFQGGTLAVSRNGKLLMARGYGWHDHDKRLLLDPHAPLRIASLSKPITAAAIMKLIREGKLKLDAKAFTLLGILTQGDDRLKDITIDHLLKHRGGWDRSVGPINDPMFQSVKISKELGIAGPASAHDVIRYMAGQKLQFAPGEKTVYSNFGYCVLGRVVEKASGKRYDAYIRQDLLGPLGITSVELARSLPKDRNRREPVYIDPGFGRNVVQPLSTKQVPNPDGTFHIEAMDAHGGLIASAPDLIRFLNAYWMDGQRRTGNGRDFTHYGDLPGTWTMMRQRADGVNIVALFNQRSGTGKNNEIRTLMDAAATKVQSWP